MLSIYSNLSMFNTQMLVQGTSGLKEIPTFTTSVPRSFNMFGLNMISDVGRLGLVSTLETLPSSSTKLCHQLLNTFAKWFIYTLDFLCTTLMCLLRLFLVFINSPHSTQLYPVDSICFASIWYLTLVDLDWNPQVRHCHFPPPRFTISDPNVSTNKTFVKCE